MLFWLLVGAAIGAVMIYVATRIAHALVDAERRRERGRRECVIALGPPATRGDAIIDPVAGEIHPWPSGPCSVYMPDFRSNICAQCDWPSEAHP